MIRGKSSVNFFELPFDADLVKEIHVVYFQNDVEVLRKTTADFQRENRYIGVELSQEEALKFDHKINLEIQFQTMTFEGVQYISPIYVVNVRENKIGEVIT